MDFTKYTKRQSDIICGRVKPYRVIEMEYRRLYAKALFAFDGEAVKIAEKELKRRGVRIFERLDYSEKQQAFMDGKSNLYEANKGELLSLYYKTQYFGDFEIGKKIEAILLERDGWKKTIEGYNSIQTALIIGDTDIYKAHPAALRGLRKVAVSIGDFDVVEYIDRIYRKRGIKHPETELNQVDDIQFLITENLYGKMKDYELNYARHLVSKLGTHPSVERKIEDEIERRSYYVRLQKYDEREQAIIDGILPVNQVRAVFLERLQKNLNWMIQTI